MSNDKPPITNADEAKAAGYSLIDASPFEVGLIKNETQGIRTWFAQDFDGRMPTLGHPKILEAIRTNEEWPSETELAIARAFARFADDLLAQKAKVNQPSECSLALGFVASAAQRRGRRYE